MDGDMPMPMNDTMSMSMQMTFYWSMSPTILFDDWTPSSTGEYFGALVAVFFMAVAYELLKYLSFVLDKSLLADQGRHSQHDRSTLIEKRSIQSTAQAVHFSFFAQIQRSVIHLLQLTLAYLLMLVVMTYNGGLFIAVVVGGGVGFFIFSRAKIVNPDEDLCH